MYTNKKNLQVKRGRNTSLIFEATNGVKQGGVLSPIVFVVYVYSLFQRLKKSV